MTGRDAQQTDTLSQDEHYAGVRGHLTSQAQSAITLPAPLQRCTHTYKHSPKRSVGIGEAGGPISGPITYIMSLPTSGPIPSV